MNATPVTVVVGAQRFAAGLCSRTGEAIGRFDDTDIVHVLTSGFMLRVPVARAADFRPGGVVPLLYMLPYMEADLVYKVASTAPVRGLKVDGASVQSALPGPSGIDVLLRPQSIIGVLIAL